MGCKRTVIAARCKTSLVVMMLSILMTVISLQYSGTAARLFSAVLYPWLQTQIPLIHRPFTQCDDSMCQMMGTGVWCDADTAHARLIQLPFSCDVASVLIHVRHVGAQFYGYEKEHNMALMQFPPPPPHFNY